MLNRLFLSMSANLRRKIAAVALLLIIFNLGAWIWAFVAFAGHPLLLGTAMLAYSFGLRHAVDPDHIAAIDNITRKLMQEGKRPVTVGLYFSLGHSTIVVLLSAVVAITAHALQGGLAEYKVVGGVISTSVSALFLFTIAFVNLMILVNTWRSFRRLKAGEELDHDDLDLLMSGGGLMARIFRRLFRLVRRGRHIYLLGLLFGLGFDTATEVGLLGLSAAGATNGLSPWSIMVFPALFSAGMALIDTADGILMLGAYGWAFLKPARKLYYNLTITSLSVAIAVVIGGIETLGLLHDKLELNGRFWDAVGGLTDNFDLLGYGIIGILVFGWAVSFAIYRLRRFDEI